MLVGPRGRCEGERAVLPVTIFFIYNLFIVKQLKSTEMCPKENGHQGGHFDPFPHSFCHGIV